MLDAILAATESLVITYTGANEYSGQPRPPAVPLGELLDVLDRTTESEVRRSGRGQAPAPALRPQEPRGRSSRHAGTLHVRPDRTGRGAGRGGIPAATPGVPGRAAGAAGGATMSRWLTCWRSSVIR